MNLIKQYAQEWNALTPKQRTLIVDKIKWMTKEQREECVTKEWRELSYPLPQDSIIAVLANRPKRIK